MLKAELDEVVAHTSKGVGQVKPGDVNSLLVGLGVLDHLLEHLDVLHASVDVAEEGFL